MSEGEKFWAFEEHETYWEFRCEGVQVTRCAYDCRFELLRDGGYRFAIEEPFSVVTSEGDRLDSDPAGDPQEMAAPLRFLRPQWSVR